eukprot:COSAG01_NODE_58756_length_304_cov_0.751220_2_plen_46_part_01
MYFVEGDLRGLDACGSHLVDFLRTARWTVDCSGWRLLMRQDNCSVT